MQFKRYPYNSRISREPYFISSAIKICRFPISRIVKIKNKKRNRWWMTKIVKTNGSRSALSHAVQVLVPRPCPTGIRLIESKETHIIWASSRCEFLLILHGSISSQCPVLRIPASPRASHYKAKEIEKVLSKLNFSYLFRFALLHFSRVLPAGIEPTTAP